MKYTIQRGLVIDFFVLHLKVFLSVFIAALGQKAAIRGCDITGQVIQCMR